MTTYEELCQRALTMVRQAHQLLKADPSVRANLPIDSVPPMAPGLDTNGEELWDAMKGLYRAAVKFQRQGSPHRLALVEQITLVEGLL